MNNFADGLKLMVIGMGMVFVFLSLMVWLMGLMSKMLEPYAHMLKDNSAKSRVASGGSHAAAAPGNFAEIAAAITAAVHKYRSRR